MQFFASLVRSVYAATILATTGYAPSFSGDTKHNAVGAAKAIESFHPESSFETFDVNGIDHPLSDRPEFSLEDAAVSFVQSRLNITSDAVAFRTGYANDVIQHAYIHQQINGITVANAVANVAFNKKNRVVSFGSSFVQPSSVPSNTPSISVTDAIAKAESQLAGEYNGHPTTLEFVAKEDGSVALAHVVQIQDDDQDMWVEAFVDAHTGDIVHLTDFGAHASASPVYRALPLREQNVTQGFRTIKNPQNKAASPIGWHNNGVTKTNNTSGNNVITYVRGKGGARYTTPQSSAPLIFNYMQDPTKNPNATRANVHAARVNAFYVVNTMHDIFYLYGFTERASNFQNTNFGKGGWGNDRVEVSVQDTRGKNNAFFYTPPDGQHGYMKVYLFNRSVPMRDGALENDLVVHETTHGITNRMTGGGTARCLQTLESKGLGEGWSDAVAEWTEWTNATITDWVFCPYLKRGGFRIYPYSTNSTTDPLKYSSLKTLTEEHRIGAVWGNILHNVYAALVSKHGFSATAKTDPKTKGGNTVFLHLLIDALALQPCNPTFPQARAAWIQADANRYGGANKCTLWKAFASRGLGIGAANRVDSKKVPAGC
ncbi:hypothetical protein GSI_05234 [Ganoderma sinense ZZ0214-1]|uniref:Extracellular metalloproteinase n=1 Tax=Ganoderma sinense ZZ0214-1 TaxID=1077348 RepID=A0A2G8SFL5_9APHY|nr:hypothetical protein GSI_05234 [Ganoderma sinense ZZ0214-1]